MSRLRRPSCILGLLALAVAVSAGGGWSAADRTGSSAGAAAVANSCDITQAKSLEGKVRTNIRFVNKTAGVVKIYWLDYNGKRVYYNTLAAGARYVQPTWQTHPWVVINASGACIGYVIAPKAEYVITEGSSGGAPAEKKPTFTSVVCNIVVNSSGSTCAAQVADAGIGRSTPPSGTVDFSASSGTVGSSCTLAGTPGSPGIASCTVSYVPSANLVQGEPPPVTARYSGDAMFAASSGGSSYQPASVLGPSTLTATGSGGIPTDLVNQNPFPVSADEVLTVSGGSLSSMHVVQGARQSAAAKVIGSASFKLKPFASKGATIELNAAGRALLAKHKSLHALLTVTTHAAGRPTKKTTRRLLIRLG